MKIICSGGGGREEAYLVDKHYCAWLKPESKILYWPIAMSGKAPDPSYPECLEWIRETLGQFDIKNIEIWESLANHDPEELENYDGLYIGGGNTFKLLREIRECGWFEALLKTITEGMPTYGGSAGAIILGRNILTSHDPDPTPEKELDTKGLNLLNGISIWCHYEEKEDHDIYAYVKKYQTPVIACPEEAGVVVEGNKAILIGSKASYYFDGNSRSERMPGSNLVVSG